VAWVEDEGAAAGEGGGEAADADEALIVRARRAIAEGRPGRAKGMLDGWIKANERTSNPWLAHAYLLRGDARVAMGDEYKALFDYELICRDFASSPEFVLAVQREFEIGRLYAGGMKRKLWGMRIEDAWGTGEELLVRVQERLPGSALAEEAAFTLADAYFQRRELDLAADMYGIILENFPESERREHAALRQIYCNMASFKGPRYDGSRLVEARLLIEDFRDRYPADAEAAGITDGLVNRIDESEALQMLDSARWYLGQKDEPAARLVLRRLIRKHPETSAAAQAVTLMVDRGWLRVPVPGESALGEREVGAGGAVGESGVGGARVTTLDDPTWEPTP
jgi:outer membrane protein assembly factor BamD (BamD/ComL family)